MVEPLSSVFEVMNVGLHLVFVNHRGHPIYVPQVKGPAVQEMLHQFDRVKGFCKEKMVKYSQDVSN